VLSLVSLTRAILGAGPAGALGAPNFAPGKIVFARAKKETRLRCGEPPLGFSPSPKAIRNTYQNKKAAEAALAKQKIEIRPFAESAPDISAAIPLWTPDDSYRG
jgi:hypothetical protein